MSNQTESSSRSRTADETAAAAASSATTRESLAGGSSSSSSSNRPRQDLLSRISSGSSHSSAAANNNNFVNTATAQTPPPAPPIINVLNPRKRFLSVTQAINRSFGAPIAGAATNKRVRTMETDAANGAAGDDQGSSAGHNGNSSATDAEKRPNFSAIGTPSVSIAKTPTSTAKPGDIRKLVIKNFKCKYVHVKK